MTERSIFECDGCGDRHGHRTEMTEVPVRYSSGEFEKPDEETLHLCIDCYSPSVSDVTDVYHYFLATRPDGEVVGLLADDTVVHLSDITVENHGNVAIIEDAAETVEAVI